MPAYRFELVSETETIWDQEAVEARSDEHAIRDAVEAIRELAQEGPQPEWFGWRLNIYEGDGKRWVLSLALSYFAVEVLQPTNTGADSNQSQPLH